MSPPPGCRRRQPGGDQIPSPANLIDANRPRGLTRDSQLFFVSSVYFLSGFKHHAHPPRVTIDLAEAHVWDQTGMRALDQVIRKLQQAGSSVEVVNLNQESLNLFERISESPEAVLG